MYSDDVQFFVYFVPQLGQMSRWCLLPKHSIILQLGGTLFLAKLRSNCKKHPESTCHCLLLEHLKVMSSTSPSVTRVWFQLPPFSRLLFQRYSHINTRCRKRGDERKQGNGRGLGEKSKYFLGRIWYVMWSRQELGFWAFRVQVWFRWWRCTQHMVGVGSLSQIGWLSGPADQPSHALARVGIWMMLGVQE